MKWLVIGMGLAVAVVGGLLFVEAGEPPANAKAALMKKKLEAAQMLLEGLAMNDFAKLDRQAEELQLISKKAEWAVLKTPEYLRHSEEFRRNAADVQAAARRKNIDLATLGYLKLTTSCVECHKHLRETKIAALPQGGDAGTP